MTPEEIKALQEVNEKLMAQVKDLANKGGDDKELRKQLEAVEAERKELIEARDKAKAKAREAEEGALAEQGKYKELYETQGTKLTDLEKQIATSSGIIEGYQVRDKKELDGLVEKLPEALRGTVIDESIPLAKQLELARVLATNGKPDGPGYKGAGEGGENVITRDAFEVLGAVERGKFVADGGRVTD
jgi:hypothetical protein